MKAEGVRAAEYSVAVEAGCAAVAVASDAAARVAAYPAADMAVAAWIMVVDVVAARELAMAAAQERAGEGRAAVVKAIRTAQREGIRPTWTTRDATCPTKRTP